MATIGYGALFGIFNGTTYVAVAELLKVTPPQYSRDAVETTHMQSTGRYREFIPGMLNGGEVTLEISFTPSAADVILAALENNSLGSFRITHQSGITVTFSAVPTNYNPGLTIDDRNTASVTLKVSGKPLWA